MKDLKHLKRFNESEENLNSHFSDSHEVSISDVSDSWWKKLQPYEQQDLAHKYFPENMFGALGLGEKDIIIIYTSEVGK